MQRTQSAVGQYNHEQVVEVILTQARWAKKNEEGVEIERRQRACQ
jgi:hypothetical protein